jgi:hypothetical protein
LNFIDSSNGFDPHAGQNTPSWKVRRQTELLAVGKHVGEWFRLRHMKVARPIALSSRFL